MWGSAAASQSLAPVVTLVGGAPARLTCAAHQVWAGPVRGLHPRCPVGPLRLSPGSGACCAAGRTLLLAAARPGLSAPRLPARAALFRVAGRLGFQSPVGVSGEGVSSASAFPGSQPRPQNQHNAARLALQGFFFTPCLFSEPAWFLGRKPQPGSKFDENRLRCRQEKTMPQESFSGGGWGNTRGRGQNAPQSILAQLAGGGGVNPG